jgi:hypothetical protein
VWEIGARRAQSFPTCSGPVSRMSPGSRRRGGSPR